mmetsp:Transcript_27336/g.62313  ORF Transcript_27336/g.62313 Transcript_27336/m.62313 type:complete len:172 (-) Transcript_27336:124-639(-)
MGERLECLVEMLGNEKPDTSTDDPANSKKVKQKKLATWIRMMNQTFGGGESRVVVRHARTSSLGRTPSTGRDLRSSNRHGSLGQPQLKRARRHSLASLEENPAQRSTPRKQLQRMDSRRHSFTQGQMTTALVDGSGRPISPSRPRVKKTRNQLDLPCSSNPNLPALMEHPD